MRSSRRTSALGWIVMGIGAAMASASATEPSLDVSIAAFDPGVPEDRALQRDLDIFPRIRKIEALLIPFVLRDLLAGREGWGAVRVVPEPDREAELLVTGTILRSDGEALELGIRAADASGRVWIEEQFAGTPGQSGIHEAIARRLAEVRDALDARTLENVREISLLRYGSWLAPTAFDEYLEEGDDGSFRLLRLPARDDPMLARIRQVREAEYVITDAIDAKFRELYAGIARVYKIWREYRRKNLEYQAQGARRASSNASQAPRGSFEDLRTQYDNYKWDRVTAQEQDALAVAFDNEVGNKVAEMELRVAELETWLDRKAAEWHRLLEALFEAETAIEQ